MESRIHREVSVRFGREFGDSSPLSLSLPHDTLLFLGGMEQSTLEYISKMCGKTTIDNRNVNESKGQSGSYSLNYQVLGRDLITPDEVGGLKGRECILKIRGCRPFRSKKYDIEDHRNFKLLSDSSESNWFEIAQRKDVGSASPLSASDKTTIQ